MSKTPFMGTTEVPPQRSAAQIIERLVMAGARAIQQRYGAAGKLEGVDFILEIDGTRVAYQLPARVDPVYKLLTHGRGKLWPAEEEKFRTKAERVAWRQLFRWVEAQLAMIQSGMAQTSEVFMPYAIDRSGRTAFQVWREDGLKMLASPPEEVRA